MKVFFLTFHLCICLLLTSMADIRSTSGNIHIDPNSDDNNDFTINSDGTGIGTATPAANLHVVGNAIVSGGNLILGTTGSDYSTLEVNGSFAYGVQTFSANATLEGNTFAIADTSSDNILLTLPYAGNVTGRHYLIKKVSANNQVWVSGGGNTIDGQGTITLEQSSVGFPFINLVSDGVNWQISSRSSGSLNVAASNLTGWWKLDETSGNTANDSSGSGNHGNLLGGFDFSGNGTTGQIDRALDFDGSNNYIRITTNNGFLTLPSTITAWINVSSKNAGIYTDANETLNNPYWGVQMLATGKVRSVIRNDAATTNAPASTTTVGGAGWFHVAATFNGLGHTSIFVNAVNENSQSNDITGAMSVDHGDIGALRYSSANQYIDGLIDDLRIYNKELTPLEIQMIYQNGQ